MTDKNIDERVSACEDGLTAIETILRTTFPQFFCEVESNGDTETDSGSETESEESTGETSEETAS